MADAKLGALVGALKDNMVAESKARTKLWAEKYGYTEAPPDEKKSEKALKLEKILGEKSVAQHATAFAALASILLGEKLTVVVKAGEIGWIHGSVLVPVGNQNSHNYPIGQPALHFTGDQFLRKDGQQGNHMSNHRADMRPATDEEIEAYYNGLSADQLNSVMQMILKHPV